MKPTERYLWVMLDEFAIDLTDLFGKTRRVIRISQDDFAPVTGCHPSTLQKTWTQLRKKGYISYQRTRGSPPEIEIFPLHN